MQQVPMIPWSIGIYSSSMLLGLKFEIVLFFWPHLFLLAFQRLAEPRGNLEIFLAMILGLGLVVLGAATWQRRIGAGKPRGGFVAFWNAVGVVTITLGVTTVAAFCVAFLLGWPVGV